MQRISQRWILAVILGLLPLTATSAIPDGFKRVDSGDPAMLTYRGPNAVEVRTKSITALRADNSTDPDLRSKDAMKRLESALYIMDLGMPEITGILDDNPRFPMVEGIAYTEDGDEVGFAATWQGRPDEQVLVLVLAPASNFDAAVIEKIARQGWRREYSANVGTALPAAVAKTTKPQRQPEPNQPTQPGRRAALEGYPVPAKAQETDRRWADWHYISDYDVVGRANDPGAPRARLMREVAPASRGPDYALKKAIKQFGISSKGYHKIVETQIARELVGDPNYVTLGRSKRNGKNATYFAQIYQGKDSDSLSVLLIEADNETYANWGAIAAGLSASGVIDHPNDIPKEYRAQLAAATHEQQLAFYHMAYTEVMKSYLVGMVAANISTVTMMQNINYDLLFDGTISLETLTNTK